MADGLAATYKFFMESGKKVSVFWNVIFYLTLLVTICLFVYKADYTGTTYDESLTFLKYCNNIHIARHTFDSTNNHVLNSIFTFFAIKLFRFYEQYIRIFPMLSGFLFFAGIAYIVKKILSSPALQVAALLLIYFAPYTFNYLFMARGYTYGLSGMVLYIGLVFYLLSHPIAFRWWLLPVMVFSLLNFYVLGAMLSGIYIMVFLNALFVLLIAPKIYKDRKDWFWPFMLNAAGIAVLSGAALYFFYRPILTQVLDVYNNPYLAKTIAAWKGWPSFSRFFEVLLRRQIYDMKTYGRYLYYAGLLLVGISFVVYIVGWIKAIKHKYGRSLFNENREGVFLLLVVVIYFLVLFVYGGLLGRCPGLERSHLFLLPLVGLIAVWLIENALRKLSGSRFKTACAVFMWLFIVVTALHKVPYMHSVGVKGMAMSKPTLQRLKALDPEQTWNIVFSRSMYTYAMEFRYYQQFDTYKFNLSPQNYNVLICRPKDKLEQRVCLDYEYFLEQNTCYVYVLTKLNWERMILEAKPLIRD